jgi:hypothetical protein
LICSSLIPSGPSCRDKTDFLTALYKDESDGITVKNSNCQFSRFNVVLAVEQNMVVGKNLGRVKDVDAVFDDGGLPLSFIPFKLHLSPT